MKKIEDVVLSYSNRGMNILREYLDDDYCLNVAQKIISWDLGNVFLLTGFYVEGYAETDGPVGTCVLAKALENLGFHVIIITDIYCTGFFEIENIDVLYLTPETSEKEMEKLVENYKPKGMISIERCGKNQYGKYANMKGVNIGKYTAPLDILFERYIGIIPTIGVGDGGNEIGMGNLSDVISKRLLIEPCVIKTDDLVIASTSNWGAYGITCALGMKTGKKLLPTFEWIENYLKKTIEIGSIDGVTHKQTTSVDGNGMDVEEEIINNLRRMESGEVII